MHRAGVQSVRHVFPCSKCFCILSFEPTEEAQERLCTTLSRRGLTPSDLVAEVREALGFLPQVLCSSRYSTFLRRQSREGRVRPMKSKLVPTV